MRNQEAEKDNNDSKRADTPATIHGRGLSSQAGSSRGLRHTIVTCLVTCFVTCLVFHFLLHSDNFRYSSHVSALANTDPYSPLLTEVLPISTCNNIQPSHHITPSKTRRDVVRSFLHVGYCMYRCFPVLLPRSEQQHQLSKKVHSVVQGNNSSSAARAYK